MGVVVPMPQIVFSRKRGVDANLVAFIRRIMIKHPGAVHFGIYNRTIDRWRVWPDAQERPERLAALMHAAAITGSKGGS